MCVCVYAFIYFKFVGVLSSFRKYSNINCYYLFEQLNMLFFFLSCLYS